MSLGGCHLGTQQKGNCGGVSGQDTSPPLVLQRVPHGTAKATGHRRQCTPTSRAQNCSITWKCKSNAGQDTCVSGEGKPEMQTHPPVQAAEPVKIPGHLHRTQGPGVTCRGPWEQQEAVQGSQGAGLEADVPTSSAYRWSRGPRGGWRPQCKSQAPYRRSSWPPTPI